MAGVVCIPPRALRERLGRGRSCGTSRARRRRRRDTRPVREGTGQAREPAHMHPHGEIEGMNEPRVVAHRFSIKHREQVLSSDICGCLYCLKTFRPAEIEEWVDKAPGTEVGQTALCRGAESTRCAAPPRGSRSPTIFSAGCASTGSDWLVDPFQWESGLEWTRDLGAVVTRLHQERRTSAPRVVSGNVQRG